MNTKASVAYGWAALTVFGVGGSYMGWRSVQENKPQRAEEQKARLLVQREQAAQVIERLKAKKLAEAEQQASRLSTTQKPGQLSGSKSASS